MTDTQPESLNAKAAPIQRTVYAVTAIAFKWDGVGNTKAGIICSLTWAVNADEARGRALRESEETHPAADGWQVNVVVVPMPREMAQGIAGVLASEEGWPAPKEEDND